MFETLQSYYHYLENDRTLVYDYTLSDKLITLANKIENANEKEFCNYELFISEYNPVKGKLNPKITHSDGQHYPDLSIFKDDMEYVKLRAKEVINPKYKAKYNQLLWESKHKNLVYVKVAIDKYIEFIQSSQFPLTDAIQSRILYNYLENVFILSQSVNHRKEDVLDFSLTRLKNSDINGFTKTLIIRLIIDDGKKIEKTIIEFLFNYVKKIISDSIHSEHTLEYLQLLLALSNKLALAPTEHLESLAEYYLTQAKKEKQSFIIHDYYLKALSYYRKAGNKSKVEEVSVLLEKEKPNLEFKAITTELSDEKVQKYFKIIDDFTTELIEKYSSTDIYEYILLSDKIFPKASDLNRTQQSTMMKLVNVMSFDINKNISKDKEAGINAYSSHIQMFSLHKLQLIFRKGIMKNKISYESFLSFLKNNTWYGMDMTYVNADGEKQGFDWIELLSPSVESFFKQSYSDISEDRKDHNGYVLCIDSLTLKFEGLLREFSRNIGSQTIEIKENGTEERISFEKLLENEKLNAIIPEDDIALFKFLFMPDGINLRNNVAHCFFKSSNYSPAMMFLLLSALLKLGNYTFIRE